MRRISGIVAALGIALVGIAFVVLADTLTTYSLALDQTFYVLTGVGVILFGVSFIFFRWD